MIPQGEYVVGTDIKPGKYEICMRYKVSGYSTINDPKGVVRIYSNPDDVDNDNADPRFSSVLFGSDWMSISLKDGEVLDLYVSATSFTTKGANFYIRQPVHAWQPTDTEKNGD